MIERKRGGKKRPKEMRAPRRRNEKSRHEREESQEEAEEVSFEALPL